MAEAEEGRTVLMNDLFGCGVVVSDHGLGVGRCSGETREKDDDERDEGAACSISACWGPVVVPTLSDGKAGGKD
jgi:hypothetical protein